MATPYPCTYVHARGRQRTRFSFCVQQRTFGVPRAPQISGEGARTLMLLRSGRERYIMCSNFRARSVMLALSM